MTRANTRGHAVKTMNLLDTYDGHCVSFHATEEDRDAKRPTIVLQIEGNSLLMASSRTLPTNGWSGHAFAVQRAREFFLLSGMIDTREESP